MVNRYREFDVSGAEHAVNQHGIHAGSSRQFCLGKPLVPHGLANILRDADKYCLIIHEVSISLL